LRELVNLLVDLDDRFAPSLEIASIPGVRIETTASPGDRVLAWIDATFGGWWSSEARAATCVVAWRGDVPVAFAAYDPHGLRFGWLRGLAREPGVGVFGPFGVVEGERGTGLGRLLLRVALAGLRERGYARALIPAVGAERLIAYYADAAGARVAERFAKQTWSQPVRTVVMASGNGSNFQAVLDRCADGTLPLDVTALVANDARAYALERARAAGLARVHIVTWARGAEARADYDARLLATMQREAPELVLLLGWMHLLTESFVRAFPHTINVHPSFLPLDPACDDVGMPDGTRIPAFRGAHAVRDALAAGSTWTGASVHGVTPATDRGPVLVRRPLRIEPGEAEDAVFSRLHPVEHELVTLGVKRWIYERD
jgi:phosphoribosylglycinamide formyltransferase 1